MKTVYLTLSILLSINLCLNHAYASSDSIEDAIAKTVKSMESSMPDDVKTIAIWEISDKTSSDIYMFDLLDNLELSLINSPRFDIVDRTQLSQILEEQKFSLSGVVDPERRKKVGELTGVDAFLYGEVVDTSRTHEGINDMDYYTTLNMRLLDVKTGTLVWERKIQGHNEDNIIKLLGGMPSENSKSKIEDATEKIVTLLEKVIGSGPGITTLAIWKIDDDTKSVNMVKLYNKLSFQLSKSPKFRVVDRSNIGLLLGEQKLSLEGIANPSEQEKIGKLWGIDGFIFGRIPKDGVTKEGIEMSLRVIDVDNGTLVWGDRITGMEHSIILPRLEHEEFITGLPQRPKKSRIDSIPGKIRKPEVEHEKHFTWISAGSSGLVYLISGLMGIVGTSNLGTSPEYGLSMIAVAIGGFGVGVTLDYLFSPSIEKPIPQNIEYNRRLDAEIRDRNRGIEEYNAQIDAEITKRNAQIAERNKEVDEWNKNAQRANILLKYLRPGE